MLGYNAVITTGECITVNCGGEITTIGADALNFQALCDLVKAMAPIEKIKEALTPADQIRKAGEKAGFEIRINDSTGAVGAFFQGNEINSKLSEMLVEMFVAGNDFEPLRNFLIKALSNRDAKEADVLYDFVINNKLPITPDGDFLAFKATHSDGFDRHRHTVQYRIGEYLHVTNFDPDKRTQCGVGLHVGGRNYVKRYGNRDDAYWIVKVNPSDTVFYRADTSDGKMRVSKLFVYAQCYGGSALDEFVPFMVAHSPEGDLLENAAKKGKKVQRTGGLTAQVATQAPAPKNRAERKVVNGAKESQSFVTNGVRGQAFTTKDGKIYSTKTVLEGVKEHGQRGFASMTGVARTTIQGWLDTINGTARKR